jgi:hypothetical protein
VNTFYYTVDGKRFNNKTLGLLYAKNIGSDLHWYYYDKEFSQYNWTIEPTESLDELYRRRAQQLRDQYKKIAICYSGGYDSTNIINTFLENKLFIDEVIIVGAFSKDKQAGSDENHNGEIYYNAFPKLKELDPRTKVTIIDYTTLWDKLELVKQYDVELLSNLNTHYSPHHWFWYQLSEFTYNKEDTAIIWGCDKPLVFKKNNKFYHHFSDAAATSYGFQGRMNYDNQVGTTNINFYWSTDCVPLIIKQCHTIKRLSILSSGLIDNMIFLGDDTEREKHIAKIIYPKIKLPFKSPKSNSLDFSLRDRYLEKDLDSMILKLHTKSIETRKTISNSEIYFSKSYEL